MIAVLEMPLSDQLREAIKNSNKSATQLAKELKMSQPTISRFLAGNDIKFSVAERIAEYFDLELSPTPKPALRADQQNLK